MAIKKPLLHYALDEVRYNKENDTSVIPNLGSLGGHGVVKGSPRIVHDSKIGTCLLFDGEEDYVEIKQPEKLKFQDGFSAAVWVRYDAFQKYSRIFDLNTTQNKSDNILFVANSNNSKKIILGVKKDRFELSSGIKADQWTHFAITQDKNGKIILYVNGNAVNEDNSKSFKMPDITWTMGYVGESSYDDNEKFKGAMAHLRMYDYALAAAEINTIMHNDQNSMAHYRETSLLKIDLYTVRDDDHKPVLYIESDNKSEPLEVSLRNPHPTTPIKLDRKSVV